MKGDSPAAGTAWLVLGTDNNGCDARMTVRMDGAKLRLIADELGRLADDMERYESERRERYG